MRIPLKHLLTLLFCGLMFFGLKAQKDFNEPGIVMESKAVHLGKTSAVRDLTPLGPVSKEKKAQWKKENKQPRNFLGRGMSKVVHPELEHQGADKLRQGILSGTKSSTANVLVNMDGITNDSPNDPSGDIGKDHYVLGINATEIAVYDKAGTLVMSFAANTLWQEIGFSSAGDPIILYDQVEDRWIITEFPSGNQLLVAISENSDPLGSYDVYNFQTPNFPDYPKYGIWKDVITVTTNENGIGNLTTYFINKTELYKAAETVSVQRLNLPGASTTEAGFYVTTPVDWMGQTEPKTSDPIFVHIDDSSWGGVDEDQISVVTVNVDFLEPTNTTFSTQGIVTEPFDGFPCSVPGFGFSCLPQGGNGGGLDGIPEVIMNQAIYRNFNTHESMVMNFITDVTDGENLSGIRWVELRRTTGEWELYQEGTFSPDDGLDRWMGGIAMDGSGNIGLAYNVASEDVFVGVRFTGRKHDDELGVMTIPETILAEGENTISSGARFGDYAQMGVDPINERTFWYVTEYGKGAGSSSATRIAAFEIERDAVDIGAHRFNGEITASFQTEEEISIQVNNFGMEDITSFTAGYIFNNGSVVTQEFNEPISSGAFVNVTFDETVNFAGGGAYPLVAFTQLESDDVIVNDSFRINLNNIVALDAGIVTVSMEASTLCEEFATAYVTISNFGSNNLTSADIELTLNGDVVYNEEWTGDLEFCQSETIEIELTDFISGENEIEAHVSNPNQDVDQGLLNNSSSSTFTFIENAVELILNFQFDQYPGETTYEVIDAEGNIISAGGPYTGSSAQENFCADPDACYTFILYDSYGDGIFNPGGYEILDQAGNILASILNNNFGFQEANDFCGTFMCMLEVDIDVTPAGANGGTILITPQNGVGPFSYSIDGGATFQDSPIFEGIPAGNYEIIVLGGEDCTFEGIATVNPCSLSVVVEFEDESNINKGSIVLLPAGGVEPYTYSIDGGENFQDNNLFNELVAGDYEVVVRDALGCEFTQTVTINFVVSNKSHQLGYHIIATPNPTSGTFHLTITGEIPSGERLSFKIYDSAGKVVRSADMVRYDDVFVTQITLDSEVSGIYYIRVEHEDINELVRVVKI